MASTASSTRGQRNRGHLDRPTPPGPHPPSHAPFYPTTAWRPGLDPTDPEYRRTPEGVDQSSPLLRSSKPPSHSEHQRPRISNEMESSMRSTNTKSQESGGGTAVGMLPLFSEAEMKTMSTEQMLQEIDITNEQLEVNNQRQHAIVKQRWREAKLRLRRLKELEMPPDARSKQRVVPPPRWPDLGPSAALPNLLLPSVGGSSPSRSLVMSASTPQMSSINEKDPRPVSAYEPEELFGWMRSLYEPGRSQATLRRVLAPIPVPVKKAPTWSSFSPADAAGIPAVGSAEQVPSRTPTPKSPGTRARDQATAEEEIRLKKTEQVRAKAKNLLNGAARDGRLQASLEKGAKQKMEEKAKRRAAVKSKARTALTDAALNGRLKASVRWAHQTPEERTAERIATLCEKAKLSFKNGFKSGALQESFQNIKESQAQLVQCDYLKQMRILREKSYIEKYPEEYARDLAVEEQEAAEVSFTLEIDRQKCLVAWKRMSSQGEIPTNQILSLLSMAGQKRGDQSWVDSIMEEHFCGRSTLDTEDFESFIDIYERQFHEFIVSEFAKADDDDSGQLSAGEMTHLLRKFGFSPAPWTVRELILEITGVENGLVGLGLEQFMQLNQRLLQRAGFTKSEAMQLKVLFRRYDRSGDGEIETKELSTALSWSGFACGDDAIAELISGVDKDNSGSFNEHEFFTIMRRHHEVEVNSLHKAFSEADKDHSGSVDLEELPKVFDELGYWGATPSTIREGIRKCGLMPHVPGEHLFEDVYILLDWFRQNEGFSEAELLDAAESFKKFDSEGTGRIGGMDIGNAIRWLGYPQTVDQLLDVLEEFDIDDGIPGTDMDGTVTMPEFLKIMRHYKEEEIKRVRDKFKERDADGSGALNLPELKQVLLHLGYTPCKEKLKTMFKELSGEEEEVGLWDLEGLINTYSLKERQNFRIYHGFIEKEVAKFQKKFDHHDPQKDGFVDNKDLQKMLTSLFPGATMAQQKQAKAALRHAEGEGGDGKLNFMEFLKMMRFMQDKEDLRKYNREKDAVGSTKFSRKEVAEYRAIFQMFDADNSGEMDFAEFLVLISQILPPSIVKSVAMTAQLEVMFENVHIFDSGGEKSLNFPGFLRIMRTITDDNFGGINDLAAEKQEAEKAEKAAKAK